MVDDDLNVHFIDLKNGILQMRNYNVQLSYEDCSVIEINNIIFQNDSSSEITKYIQYHICDERNTFLEYLQITNG